MLSASTTSVGHITNKLKKMKLGAKSQGAFLKICERCGAFMALSQSDRTPSVYPRRTVLFNGGWVHGVWLLWLRGKGSKNVWQGNIFIDRVHKQRQW
jgi:hypothetical protein